MTLELNPLEVVDARVMGSSYEKHWEEAGIIEAVGSIVLSSAFGASLEINALVRLVH